MSQLVRMEKVEGLVGGIVFGPVRSRRFGRSLGINPLPPDRKLCTFDCVYCECGRTSPSESRRLDEQPFPPVEKVADAVRNAIASLHRAGVPIDSLTLTGNGETTLHPHFEEIIGQLLLLRDHLLPDAQIVVLTNGTRLSNRDVRRALERVDQCVVKIDAGTERMFQLINRPIGPISLEEITRAASELPHVIVQTLFVRGRVDNTTDDEIEGWIERVATVRPQRAQIYSLDRPPAEGGLVAIPLADLDRIAARLTAHRQVPVDVY
jgi:wyosine [tRNA(Phe)-imidazoG37] synthetase (radical SAM superfamily)